MNRRQLLATAGRGLAGYALVRSALMISGCNVAQVVLDVEGVLEEAAAITGAAGQTTWSADFTTAANALQAAYNVWDQSTTSSTGQKIAALLNALVAATAIILPNDPFAPLIDECVALAELALSFWPTSTAVTARAVVRNLHIGAVLPPVSYKDALARWNAIAVGPLAAARIN
jgi:hypothetical protein